MGLRERGVQGGGQPGGGWSGLGGGRLQKALDEVGSKSSGRHALDGNDTLGL
jgi:hypothetical protein